MKARLVYHVKEIAIDVDITEIKIWQVPKSKDKGSGKRLVGTKEES